MMRLIKRGLMFGNLVPVTSPALVGRYNRALKHLTDKETALTEFHIDIAGFSPEIGDELGDNLYLNPNGCNQQFILLTTDQKTAPLLSSKFSASRSILRDFIEDNEEELFALTAREAVAGELMNSVFEINAPKDLLNIHQINIEADTVQERLAGALALQTQIDTFMKTDDAWWDDVLIANMIELAKQTGNIQRHPIALTPKTYVQGNYYTSHFGGMYIFRDVKTPTVIVRGPVEGLQNMPVENIFTFDDREGIARFLFDHNLAELIVSAQDGDNAAIIRQKLDFIVMSTAAGSGDDLGNVTRQNMRAMERKYASAMPDEYYGLLEIWRWAKMQGTYPKIEPANPSYFYAFRSAQHADRDLVNMLLSELSPLDFRQLFICHKQAFYKAYAGWPDTRKEYVAQFLEAEYMIDKAGAREALFGEEPSMEPHKERLKKERPTKKRPKSRRFPRKRDDDDDDDDDRKGRDRIDRDEWRKLQRDLRKRKRKRK